MKESTLSKITASVAVAKGMAQRALAANPTPQWTEYEMQSVDAWIARQGVNPSRSEAIRRLVELGLAKTLPLGERAARGWACFRLRSDGQNIIAAEKGSAFLARPRTRCRGD